MNAFDAWKLFEECGFFAKMREEMRKAEHKNPEPELSDYSWDQLVDHLEDEMNELQGALELPQDFGVTKHLALTEELCHVANMCGFVFAKITRMSPWELEKLKEKE